MDPDASPRVRLTADDPRPGGRPATSTEGPHRQLDQRSSPELWGRLVAAVFALDGILIGASDGPYIAGSMVVALAACGVALALGVVAGWGVRGVWAALAVLIVARLATMGARFVRRRWLVTGWA